MAPDPAPALAVTYREKVRPFIDLVDELRASGLDRDVTLPSVVVIGDQSAGKSSCLEAMSGVQLPRGSGIVTRCPLELRLKKSQDPESPWRGYIHYHFEGDRDETGWKLTDSSDVGEAVRKAQNNLAGDSHGISPRLITLDVESPDIPDLTLIDLPGIARIAVDGQPPDIGDQIKDLIKEYIQKDETIILAVVPCNVDIATTEALQMAKDVDPTGSRTLGVLTKPDLIDRGTENTIVDIVNNQKYPLKKGYTIIRCRGQEDINENVTLSEAMEKEERFFKTHEHFKLPYHEKKTGTRTLAGKLTTELVEQIKKSIPGLKEDIKKKLKNAEEQLQLLGDGIPDDPSSKMRFLVELLTGFTDDLEKLSNGEQVRSMEDEEEEELRLIAEARDAYKEFAVEINCLIPDEGNLDDIQTGIEKNRGPELPGFLPYTVCKKFIQKHMKDLKDPAIDCLLSVNQKVETVAALLTNHWFRPFAQLNMEVKEKVNELRLAQEKTAREAINQLFEMEHLVFTQDAIFNIACEDLEKAEKDEEDEDELDLLSDLEKEAQRMLHIIKVYFRVSIRRLSDIVPMTISLHLMAKFTSEVKSQVLLMIGQPETLELLHEDSDITEERNMLWEKRKRLTKASQKLAKF